jgi:hypothetical protein
VLNKAATTIKTDTNLASEYMYAVQGQFDSQSFTSSGGKFYIQNMKFTGYMDTDYLSVKVNDEEWSQVASLYDMGPNKKEYAIRYNPVAGIDIMFGNDVNGKALKYGDVIEISYLLHDGESGNIDTKESGYFLFADKLKDISGEEVDGNSVFDISFASEDAVAAGADPETLEQIKLMIGYNSRSLVLSDSNAYKAFLNRFSFVGYNRTWSEPGSLVVNSMVMRNYQLDMSSGEDYFDLRPNQFSLSDIQKTSIQNAIKNSGSQLAGTTYNIIDVELCKYACYLYIKLKSSSTDTTLISTKIRTLIGEFFGDIQSDSYVPKSDIINLIKENIDEVDGVNCYFLSERNETAIQKQLYQDTQYIYDPTIGSYRTKTVTVKLNGENPMLGLDAHGNIVVDADNQFPVLMGGWNYLNNAGDEVTINDPLIIVFE